MKTTNQIKQEIKDSLLAKKSTINVRHYEATALLRQVLSENPDIRKTISGISPPLNQDRFEPNNTFSITYGRKPVDDDSEVVYVNTYAEVESLFHECLAVFKPFVVVSFPSAIDIGKAYGDFLVLYGGFYSNLVGIECEIEKKVLSPFERAKIRFEYRIGRVKLNMMESAVRDEIHVLSQKLFCKEMKPETKAYIAHNYLAKSVEYWLKEEANPLEKSYMQSAYGALINRRCVCQGYAEAYKRIMNSQGIRCEVLCGKIKGSKEYHAWNVVSFDNKSFYHVDVTWDSVGEGNVSWNYFGKSDSAMMAARMWTRKSDIVCPNDEDIVIIARSQITMLKKLFLSKGIDEKYF